MSEPERFPLLNPESDLEVRKEVKVKVTDVKDQGVGQGFFEKFSSWQSLLRAVSNLKHIAISYHRNLPCKGWHICSLSKSVAARQEATLEILRIVQCEVYAEESKVLSHGLPLSRRSRILSLNPVLNCDGLICVGGRLSRSELPMSEKNPLILPGNHPVSKLLVQYYHGLVHHQGRHFTEGALRSAGFWITGAKRLVYLVIHNCIICKKLRGSFASQKMSDLPLERVEQVSPFSYVGVDVFGPWQIVSRRTRGGNAASKRWAVLFTCLTIRAVHIEVIEDMSSSAFINALRRFVSVRGKVKLYRSDRGTNFVGAVDSIGVEAINVEDEITENYLQKSGSVWVFNSPHSSHMGGTWERMIGIARRILDSMLANVKTLTHDVLVTLMAEVSAMINSRPIVPLSYDPEVSEVLSPATLLTLKLDCEKTPTGSMDIKDLYRVQWKQVQHLASQFWLRWQKQYLQSLQSRRKWNQEQESLKVGDVILMRDTDLVRSSWSLGRISRVFPSKDGKVRKVEVCVIKGGKKLFYTRPVTELVYLVGK